VELDTFLFGMPDFVLRARHVDAIATIEAFDGACRLADGGTQLQAPLGRELQPVRDIVMQWAVYLAERHTALGAPASLLPCPVLLETWVDFMEVGATLFRGPLVGHLHLGVNKAKHLLLHGVMPFAIESPNIPVRVIFSAAGW
jgi:hypothetical protein